MSLGITDQNLGVPWVIFRDSNSIFSHSDKPSGILNRDDNKMAQCLNNDLQLIEPPSFG